MFVVCCLFWLLRLSGLAKQRHPPKIGKVEKDDEIGFDLGRVDGLRLKTLPGRFASDPPASRRVEL